VTSSNLDEFFEIRVSGLKEKVARDLLEPGPDGLSPSASLETISETAHEIVDEQYEVLNRALLPELAQAGIRFLARDAWTPELVAWVQRYFNDQVLPVLSSMGLDQRGPSKPAASPNRRRKRTAK